MPGIEDIRLTLVEDRRDVEEMMQWLGERREWLGIDVETTGLNRGCDWIRLAQFGDGRRGFAMPYDEWKGVVREVCEGYRGRKVFHNALYDLSMLKADGIVVPQSEAHCTMVMCHLKNPLGRHDLKGAAALYVDPRSRAGQSLLKLNFQTQGWEWASVPIQAPAYWMYSTLDTCLTSLLAEKLWPVVDGCYRDAYELEMAVIHCLREAELAGLHVDEAYRQAAMQKLEAEIELLLPQLPVKNPNSDDQLREYLLSIGARWNVLTDSGKLSVDKDVLKWLAPSFPVANVIRDYRLKYKLLHNYLEKFGPAQFGFASPPGRVVALTDKKKHKGLAVDGIIRPSTRPVGAKTSRMSVTDPPLQQLPRGRVVRDAIVPKEGHCFVMADFAGMEMRALAADAREAAMLGVFNAGLDVHTETARALYGEAFTKPQRTICKNAGFAKIYGAGVEKFAVTADIDVGVARDFLMRYDQLYPGVVAYMEAVTKKIYERAGGRKGTGFVKLIDGRQIPVPGEEAYKGVNYRIQGSCAIVTKRKIDELDRAGLGPYFRLAVHDELIYEVPLDLADQARRVIDQVMPDRRSFPGLVLEIESDVVSRWGEHYRDDFPAYVPTEAASWLQEAA